MKAFGTAVIGLALILASSLCLADERKVKIATTEYPPYYGEGLENGGFITEIVIESFKRSDYEVEIKFMPWKRAYEGTKAGKYDGLYTVWYRSEREEWFAYSEPLPPNEVVFYKRKDKEISFESFEDLRPYTIGVSRGYGTPPGFDEASLNISWSKDDEENLRKLHKGRIDLALTDRIVAQYVINTIIPEAAPDLEWLPPVLHVEIQHMVFSKKAGDYAARLAAFNRALAVMKEDGTLQAIMAEHGF